MKNDWHECLRPDNSAAKHCISLNARGEIAINYATWVQLGQPWLVVLLYDPQARLIGLKRVMPGTRNAFPVRSHGARGAKVVRARRLLKQFDVPITRTIRFRDPRLAGDIWTLDLDAVVGGQKKEAGSGPDARLNLPSPTTDD